MRTANLMRGDGSSMDDSERPRGFRVRRLATCDLCTRASTDARVNRFPLRRRTTVRSPILTVDDKSAVYTRYVAEQGYLHTKCIDYISSVNVYLDRFGTRFPVFALGMDLRTQQA